MRAAHRHFKFGVKQLGSFGAMGFYHAQFADDLSDGEYDGYPEEDDKLLAAAENEDLLIILSSGTHARRPLRRTGREVGSI